MADTLLTPIYQDYTIDMSSNNNFIQVPSVQGDGNNVRYIRILLVANNTQYIVPENVTAIIAGTKPDTKNIFNNCEIDENGKILVEITSEMAAVPGRGDYQIVLIDTTENSQLKSFPFYLITTQSFNAKEIVSSNEYQALTEALSKALADYTYVIETCEGIKDETETFAENAHISEIASKQSEDNAKDSEDNAKHSEDNAKNSEDAAKESEINAKASENAAALSATNASASETAAALSETNAKVSETAAALSEVNAKTSEDNAKDSENAALLSETNAKASEDNAKDSENAAKVSEDNAKASELAAATSAVNAENARVDCEQNVTDAQNYADLAKKWAEWTDGATEPSASNNARYWAQKAKEWSGFDDIDATSVTYTKQDGTKVILADFISFIEDLDGETILVL